MYRQTSSSRENLGPAERSKESPTRNTCTKDLPENCSDYDDEYSSNYESVRFQKVEDKLVPHHYSEIEEKAKEEEGGAIIISPVVEEEGDQQSKSDENSSKSTSTPSHSRTDEMVTYLEVQTPSFKLRTSSLEDQKSSEEQSLYESVGCGGGVIGRRKNSATTTIDDESDIISPGRDDEIHFIDSPLIGVENPVYSLEMEGMNPDEIQKAQQQHQSHGAFWEDDDGDFEISMNESVSLSLSIDEDKDKSHHTTPSTVFGKSGGHQINNKSSGTGGLQKLLLGRCNSAPLTDTKQDFIITDLVYQNSDQNSQEERPSSSSIIATISNDHCAKLGRNHQIIDSNTNQIFKIPLNKRFSEPSLVFSNSSSNTLSINNNKTDNENNATAWKIADAKRLANRKQSVKELLSKFESRDSTPSPTNNNKATISSSGNNLAHIHHHNNKDTQPQGCGPPKLPKPVSQNQLKSGGCSFARNNNNHRNNNNNNADGFMGSGRFQHHRFSMGDILLGSQSMSESDDLNSSNSPSPQKNSIMIRSDTFPELRCFTKVISASKENMMADLNLTTADRSGSQSQGNLNDTTSPLVPEKVQNALRVAMSSVDMNDPCTRERIERYKEDHSSVKR